MTILRMMIESSISDYMFLDYTRIFFGMHLRIGWDY